LGAQKNEFATGKGQKIEATNLGTAWNFALFGYIANLPVIPEG
jgi:hypothetical protein